MESDLENGGFRLSLNQFLFCDGYGLSGKAWDVISYIGESFYSPEGYEMNGDGIMGKTIKLFIWESPI